jgi:hypothetical protein
VLTATGGAMTVRNVKIDGSRLIQGCDANAALAGIRLAEAGGAIDDVTIRSVSRGAGRARSGGWSGDASVKDPSSVAIACRRIRWDRARELLEPSALA